MSDLNSFYFRGEILNLNERLKHTLNNSQNQNIIKLMIIKYGMVKQL
jgi:hypothetical protein